MRHSRRRAGSPHPFNLGLALFFRFLAGWLVRSEPQWLLPFADEMLALSTEHELGFFRAGALCQRGWCLAALGNPDEGITLITSGLSLGHGVGFMLNTPMPYAACGRPPYGWPVAART